MTAMLQHTDLRMSDHGSHKIPWLQAVQQVLTRTEHLMAGQKTFFTNKTEEYYLSNYNLLHIKDWKRTSGVHLSDSSDSHYYE
jgi:hypothetical protein